MTTKIGSLTNRHQFWRTTPKSQIPYYIKYQKEANKSISLIIVFLFILPNSVYASITRDSITCKGSFVNPITDICWSCLMPISIGKLINIGGSSKPGRAPKKRDTQNPSSPLCLCTKNNIPVPGLSIGFWEPLRLVDITRTPYCMVNLGGIELMSEKQKLSSFSRNYNKRSQHSSFYHLHYYIYPLIYWLELITDFMCLESSTFDVAYMSEFDVTWNDEKLQSFLNPEAILFGNPIAQMACGLDCAAATYDKPLDSIFWCAGCLGNLYPLSGANADHVGGVQNSSLLTVRILAKMHRIGLAEETSTSSAKINGPLCRKHKALKLKKSQYKFQMVNPKSSSDGLGCWPIGLSDMGYSAFKEYPYDGQDWGYLIWRKKNCCFL